MTPEEQRLHIQQLARRHLEIRDEILAQPAKDAATSEQQRQYLRVAERLLGNAAIEILSRNLGAKELSGQLGEGGTSYQAAAEYVQALHEHVLPLVRPKKERPKNHASKKDLGLGTWTADPPRPIGGGRLSLYMKCIGGPFVGQGASQRDTGEYFGWSLTVEGEPATSETSGPLLFHYQHTPHPAFANPNLNQEPAPSTDVWINARLVQVEYQPRTPLGTRGTEEPIPSTAPFALFARRMESGEVQMDWSVFESLRVSGQSEKLNQTAHKILHRSFPQIPGPRKTTRDEARESLLNAALALAAIGKKANYKTLADQLAIEQNTVWERLDRAEWKIRNVSEHPQVQTALANYRVISGFP